MFGTRLPDHVLEDKPQRVPKVRAASWLCNVVNTLLERRLIGGQLRNNLNFRGERYDRDPVIRTSGFDKAFVLRGIVRFLGFFGH